MKKFFLGLMAVLCIGNNVSAQQDPQFTMFYFNKMLYNPAYAGAKDAICGTVLGRSQWNGLPGAPNTWVFTGDMPINLPGGNDKNQLGIGLTTYGDYIGFQQDHGLKVALAYRRKDLGPGHLAVGVDLGFANKNIINPNWICPNGLSSAVDPTIPAATANSIFAFDLNLGAYYHNTNFYVGVSMLHLTGSSFSSLNIHQARHMYFTGGYTLPLGGKGSSWKLNPNAIIRTDLVTANFDLNLNAIYDINGTHGIFFGATYRFIDAVGLNIGYNGTYGARKNIGLLFGYNYDINTSRLNSFNSGTHEIIFRFCFRIDKPTGCTGPPVWVVRYGDTMKKRY